MNGYMGYGVSYSCRQCHASSIEQCLADEVTQHAVCSGALVRIALAKMALVD